MVLRFDNVKKAYVLSFQFGFINVITFAINPYGPYSKAVGGVMRKSFFGSFGSIRTNLRSITYLVCQSYC